MPVWHENLILSVIPHCQILIRKVLNVILSIVSKFEVLFEHMSKAVHVGNVLSQYTGVLITGVQITLSSGATDRLLHLSYEWLTIINGRCGCLHILLYKNLRLSLLLIRIFYDWQKLTLYKDKEFLFWYSLWHFMDSAWYFSYILSIFFFFNCFTLIFSNT